MKIFITGANGLLGQNLIKKLVENNEHHIIASGRGEARINFPEGQKYLYLPLDITDGINVLDKITFHKPDIIIHTAAITQIDECEADQIGSWNTNVTATRFLISAAADVNARFIYISTDFVFDGLNGPYKETDLPAPINYYGSTKVAAEKSVMESNLNWCIIRTVLVYGNILIGNRSNIITWVQQNLSEGKSISVVTDQWRTPTYVDDLVDGILLALDKNATGIYHISGAEMLTPYDIAIATAKYLGLNESLIVKVDASSFSQVAKRPAKTGFIVDKAIKELSFQPLSFKASLQKMFQDK